MSLSRLKMKPSYCICHIVEATQSLGAIADLASFLGQAGRAALNSYLAFGSELNIFQFRQCHVTISYFSFILSTDLDSNLELYYQGWPTGCSRHTSETCLLMKNQ